MTGTELDTIENATKAAKEYLDASLADNTRQAYRSDWRVFSRWCAREHRESMPASVTTVVLYLSTLGQSGKKLATIRRHRSSISVAHDFARQPNPARSPEVAKLMDGIARTLGDDTTQKVAAVATIVAEMCRVLPDTLQGVRDRFLLLLGFVGAFRRSELAGLMVADITEHPEGIRVRIVQSKTGPMVKLICSQDETPSFCPVRAMRAWFERSGITEGPVFRSTRGKGLSERALSGQQIGLLVQQYAERAGLDRASFGGHSLRSGFATSAAERGAANRFIRKITGHRSDRQLDHYVQTVHDWQNNVTRRIFVR